MAEAARLKGVSYHTVSRAVRRGKLPAQRLGRMALIAADDLRDWRPMRERAPRKYRRREPNPNAAPALLDLASGERVDLASRLSTLYEVINSSAAELPLPEFLALLADRMAAGLGLRRLAIWSFEPNGRAQRLAAFGPPMSMLPRNTSVVATDRVREVFQGDDVAVVDDVASLLETGAEDLIDVRQLVVAPMRIGSRRLGFITGDNNGEPFAVTAEQLLLARGLANQAALAIERDGLLTADRRRAAQLDAVLAHVSEGVAASDADGRIVMVNDAAREILGLGDGEISPVQGVDPAATAANRYEFDGAEIPLADVPLLRAVRGERVADREYVLARADGVKTPVRVNAYPITAADGSTIGAVAVYEKLDPSAAGSGARAREAASSRR
jgi:excisionase family DNA binding protein